jgi:predicted transcriptional regulator
MPGRRRPPRTRFDIQAAIIERALPEGATLNGIVTSVNLNRKIARKFIMKLIEVGFMRVDQKRKNPFVTYSATAQGISWLKDYKTLVNPARSDFRALNRIPD